MVNAADICVFTYQPWQFPRKFQEYSTCVKTAMETEWEKGEEEKRKAGTEILWVHIETKRAAV